MEDLAAEKRFQPVLLAAGDEDLTAGDAVEDKFLPAGVQLGEHIVEQEDGEKPVSSRKMSRSASLRESAAVRVCPCEEKARAAAPPMETSMSSLWGPERQRREASSAW